MPSDWAWRTRIIICKDMLAELCVESADRFRPVASPWYMMYQDQKCRCQLACRRSHKGISSGRWRPRTLIDKPKDQHKGNSPEHAYGYEYGVAANSYLSFWVPINTRMINLPSSTCCTCSKYHDSFDCLLCSRKVNTNWLFRNVSVYFSVAKSAYCSRHARISSQLVLL